MEKVEEVVQEEVKQPSQVTIEETVNLSAEEMNNVQNDLPEEDKKLIIGQLLRQMDQVQKEVDYKMAEIENKRKRDLRQLDQQKLDNIRKLALGVIPVADDMERIMLNCPDETTRTGIASAYKKLVDVLVLFGVEQYRQEQSEKYDSEISEAILRIPVKDAELDNTVCECVNWGYKFNNIILRPAVVTVNKFEE